MRGLQWLYDELAALAESKIKEEEARGADLDKQLREVKDEPKKQHGQVEQTSKEELVMERAKVRGQGGRRGDWSQVLKYD